MNDLEKPLPRITPENAPFWEGCRMGELRLPHCRDCDQAYWPPSPLCSHCFGDAVDWRSASGRGRVSTFVIVHQKWFESFAADIPYNAAQVELDEGPRLNADIVGIENDRIEVGMAVEVVFDPVTAEITLPRFRPIGG